MTQPSLSSRPPFESIQQFLADEGSLRRLYTIDESPARSGRLRKLAEDWLLQTASWDLMTLHGSDRVDAVVFRNQLAHRAQTLGALQAQQARRIALAPFVGQIFELEENRMRRQPLQPKEAAGLIAQMASEVRATTATPDLDLPLLTAAGKALESWHAYYNGYDPVFSWWMANPYADLKAALEELQRDVKSALGSAPITGVPVGREGLVSDLAFEGVAYSPEELIAVGERELAWCNEEIAKAAAELGYPGDAAAAYEHVRNLAEAPGDQPEVIRQFAEEAIAYMEDHDLLTVPDLAKETWRMDMMSPEHQLVNPFFLGGECIIISYPTDTMTHAQKLMSMRGNCTNFSRATVQHELVPGHHMQQFMCERYRPYRQAFETPFWIEGWTLYWEMRLWELGFARGPEDRLGMLFWRKHRAARVIFSLKFHLGQMAIAECVEMLVKEVGHEQATAEGEVRRSFKGDYPPLYQAAYLIGGLQVRALQRDIVGSGRMRDRDFHDAFLHENFLPIAVLREVLAGRELQDWALPKWRFLG